MTNQPDEALAAAMLRIAGHIEEIQMIRGKIKFDLEEIRPLVIGLLVKQYGRTWKIVQADVRAGGNIDVYGVRVSGAKVGTRGFHLGSLHECEIMGRADQLERRK